jgi:lysophospholipase L1-like esterase
MTFEAYIALGDSMSIDTYPSQDAQSANLTEREDIGAAALLYSNESALFPEFQKKDLRSRLPKIKYANFAFDGATTHDLLSETGLDVLTKYAASRALITLTLGGNDLLGTFNKVRQGDSKALTREVQEISTRYLRIVKAIKSRVPACTLILTTVYDPTDGTGIMPSTTLGNGQVPLEFLVLFNRFVESCVSREKAILADVYKHFFGHGAECGSRQNFWYFSPSPIEPSYKGASEIRRVWLEAVERVLTN